MPKPRPAPALSDLEVETIDLFVRVVQILGLPRSLGQIYGLIYISPCPLSMDDLVNRLGISLGSASQGLRTLRDLNAIRATYRPGERRDYYAPEMEFRRLIAHLLEERFRPHWEKARRRLQRMESLADLAPEANRAHYQGRVEQLFRIHELAEKSGNALPRAIPF